MVVVGGEELQQEEHEGLRCGRDEKESNDKAKTNTMTVEMTNSGWFGDAFWRQEHCGLCCKMCKTIKEGGSRMIPGFWTVHNSTAYWDGEVEGWRKAGGTIEMLGAESNREFHFEFY